MYAIQLYDAIYLYLKIAHEVLTEGGTKSDITSGKNMYERAKNYKTNSGEYSLSTQQ